jgi:hypothetical protein
MPNLAQLVGSGQYGVLVWRGNGGVAPTELNLPATFTADDTTVLSDLGASVGLPGSLREPGHRGGQGTDELGRCHELERGVAACCQAESRRGEGGTAADQAERASLPQPGRRPARPAAPRCRTLGCCSAG